jgi:hypothetical protein
VASLPPRVLMALGCNGMAVYNLSNGMLNPYVEHYESGNSVFSVVRGPLGADGYPYFYASYLNEGIGLFKSTPPNWTLLDYYPTAFQVGQLVIASSDRRSVFVGDLRGGVSLWEFTLP